MVTAEPATASDADHGVVPPDGEDVFDAQAGTRAPEPPGARRLQGPPVGRPVVVGLAVVLVAAVVVAFFGVFAYGLSGLQEHRSQHQLYQSFRGLLDPASTVAPSIGGTIPVGTPVALMDAPAAGIANLMVVEGTSSDQLLAGPGHLPDSPLPGQPGQSVLIGRSTTAGAPFAGLVRLRVGDRIEVRTGQGRFGFTVTRRIEAGTRPPAIRTNQGTLLLVTAAGGNALNPLQPTRLLYVDARLTGKTAPAPRGRPGSVPAAEQPGHVDGGGLPLVLGWLAAFAIAVVVGWRLWLRWGVVQMWLIVVPVLVGLLWGLSDSAMRLLPNVY